VLRSEPSKWESVLFKQAVEEQVDHAALSKALQKRMELVVLSETSGSHSQRVRPHTACKHPGAGGGTAK